MATRRQWQHGEFVVCAEQSIVDVKLVTEWLAQTHWASRRTPEIVAKLVENSLCFSLLRADRYIGFARIVTDCTVFSWLSDLIVCPEFRGQGLGKWFIECILRHPHVSNTQVVLQTSDAHGLYEKCGFELSGKLMSRTSLAPRI